MIAAERLKKLCILLMSSFFLLSTGCNYSERPERIQQIEGNQPVENNQTEGGGSEGGGTMSGNNP